MAKRRRNCTKCIAYCNHKEIGKCGLGFIPVEDLEIGSGMMRLVAHPEGDACEIVKLPKTKEEFVETAAGLGIKWDIEDVLSVKEFGNCL